jgi:sugar phosphate isomerase/epimerase
MQIGRLIENLDHLDQVAEAGYDYVETVPWVLGPNADDRAAEQQALARVTRAPVPVASLCGFLPEPEQLGLMVVGPTVDRQRLTQYVTRVFDRMQAAGIDVIGYGSGSSRTAPAGFPTSRALEQVSEFLALCAELAGPRGVRVAVEPYNRDDTNLLYTVPEALAVVRQIDRPEVQLMADFFHMRLNDEPFDHLTAAGPWLIHAHIAEPGRGRPVTTPDDHAAFFGALRQAGYDGRVTQTGPLPAYATERDAAAALKRLAQAGDRP